MHIGLMCEKMDAEYESVAGKCKTLTALAKHPTYKSSTQDSIAHVKSLLDMIIRRLELKGKKFSPFFSASDADIDSMLECIDSTVEKRESLTAKNIDSKEGLVRFLSSTLQFSDQEVWI